jgi:hypothetical protein
LNSGSRAFARILNSFAAAPAADVVDLRTAFMLERSLTPALLVVAVLAAVTSARLGLALAIAWLAVTTLNVVARGLLAARHEFAGKPVSLRQGVGRAYVASWLLDLVVWSGLLLSLAAASPSSRDDRLFVLPGTHSKWVDVRSGSVRAFRTCMTGELYALLRHQSILGRLCEEPSEADAPGALAAFDDGVDRAAADPGAIGHLLFTVRAEGLFGERKADCLPAYLSGLLVGAEIASALATFGHREGICIIGAPALCGRYRRALARVGVEATIADGEPAREGLYAIATAAGLVDPA